MIKPVLQHEMDILRSSIDDVRKKTKLYNYDPEVIYMIVNKKINSRFFEANNHNELLNPEPGSAIIEDLSIDNRFDFHLVAQRVTQGTSHQVSISLPRIIQKSLRKTWYNSPMNSATITIIGKDQWKYQQLCNVQINYPHWQENRQI